MIEPTLRIHDFMASSQANGPGKRAVLWLQGCSLGCEGCFNPNTHSFDAGTEVSVSDFLARIKALCDSVDGLTISGGEPLLQIWPLTRLLQGIRASTKMSIVLFTGFSITEVARIPGADSLLSTVDVVIAGRFEQKNRIATGLRGSLNKTFHFLTDRLSLSDFDSVISSEIFIDESGDVFLSGIDPIKPPFFLQ